MKKSSLRILLAEDNPLNQKLILHFLRKTGHEVVVASDGKEALAALEKEPFDLILMDVQMPEMDGIEATRRIRSSKAGSFDPSIPIIALTAHVIEDDWERFMEIGWDEYLTKPLDRDRLVEVINQLTGDKGTIDTVSYAKKDADASVNLSALKFSYRDKEDLLMETVTFFLQQAPERVNELRQALERKNTDQIVRIAHSLVNLAGLVRASRSAEYARKLEEAARRNNHEGARLAFEKMDPELNCAMSILVEAFSLGSN